MSEGRRRDTPADIAGRGSGDSRCHRSRRRTWEAGSDHQMAHCRAPRTTRGAAALASATAKVVIRQRSCLLSLPSDWPLHAFPAISRSTDVSVHCLVGGVSDWAGGVSDWAGEVSDLGISDL